MPFDLGLGDGDRAVDGRYYVLAGSCRMTRPVTTVANFIRQKLKAKKVFIIDDQAAYSTAACRAGDEPAVEQSRSTASR